MMFGVRCRSEIEYVAPFFPGFSDLSHLSLDDDEGRQTPSLKQLKLCQYVLESVVIIEFEFILDAVPLNAV